MRRLVLLLLCLTPSFAERADAQVAGRKLGACEERLYLSEAQVQLAIGASLLGDGIEQRFRTISGDPIEVDGMKLCAKGIRTNVCTDKLLMGMLNPIEATGEGVAGLAAGESVLGKMLTTGVFGMAKGVTELAACNRTLATLEPSARIVFGSGRIDANALRPGEAGRMIAQAAREGRIPAADGSRMLDYVSGVSDVLAR